MKAAKILGAVLLGLFAIAQALKLVRMLLGASAYVLPKLLLVCLAAAVSAWLIRSALKARPSERQSQPRGAGTEEFGAATKIRPKAQAQSRRPDAAADIEEELKALKKQAARDKGQGT